MLSQPKGTCADQDWLEKRLDVTMDDGGDDDDDDVDDDYDDPNSS